MGCFGHVNNGELYLGEANRGDERRRRQKSQQREKLGNDSTGRRKGSM